MQHPEEGIIHAWLDGALPASEAAAIEAHVTSCAECEARVAEARGLIAASSRIVGQLDAVPGNVIPAAKPKRRMVAWRTPWIAAAAAGLIIMVKSLSDDEPRVQLTEPAAPAPVVAVTAADSAPVPQLRRQFEPQAERPREQRSARVTALTDSLVLPPANSAAQKAEVSAVVAPTAPGPPPTVEPTKLAQQPVGAQSAPANLASRAQSRAAVGAAGGVATSAPTAERSFGAAADAAESIQSFAGCYEMNASTEVLPARFALTSEASPVRGLMGVRYIDTEGRPAASIADLGWTVEGGQVVVRTQARETLLTMRKTGSAVSGESRSGSRNGRVTSCSR